MTVSAVVFPRLQLEERLSISTQMLSRQAASDRKQIALAWKSKTHLPLQRNSLQGYE